MAKIASYPDDLREPTGKPSRPTTLFGLPGLTGTNSDRDSKSHASLGAVTFSDDPLADHFVSRISNAGSLAMFLGA
jgi:hypothetical protein